MGRRARRWVRWVWLAGALVGATGPAGAQDEAATPWLDQEQRQSGRLGLDQYVAGRDFLYRSGARYENYGFDNYRLPETSFLARRNYYGPLGDFLINGYDVYEWRETRANEATAFDNSFVTKPRTRIFQQNVVVREDAKGWATALIIGEEIRTHFTPLTLSMAGINGVRLDVQAPYGPATGRLSLVASRWSAPVWSGDVSLQQQNTRRNGDILSAAHTEVELGSLRLGGSVVNYHNYDADQSAFSFRGDLRSTQVRPSYLIVKFSDDSPRDEVAGAVVNDVYLRINGQDRRDITPTFVRLNSRNPTVLGRKNRITGQFVRTEYSDGGTKFADYFYLLDHLAGENVRNVNLNELVRWIEVLPPGTDLQADGEWVILAWFDLQGEAYIESAEVRALVGNDYRIDVIGLYDDDPRKFTYESQWRPGGVEAVLRSDGNVQDLSNLEWVRVDVGAWTGRYVVGLNGDWQGRNTRIRWEWARSIDFFTYPDGPPVHREPKEMLGARDWLGERQARTEDAFYVTGEWRNEHLRGGAEVFRMPDSFDRRLGFTGSYGSSFFDGFVEDNDDDDSWPDAGPGDRPRHFGDKNSDPDGVFPGKDEDHDGIPDTNRNQNDLPDYEEAFLLFYVEPDEYVYGRDWNHNGIVDEREDDLEPDFPYQLDQEGTHLYGNLRLPGGLWVGAGRLDAEGLSSGGRNESKYVQLRYRAADPSWGSIRLETLVERVHDDIANTYWRLEEILGEPLAGGGFTFRGATAYNRVLVGDPLLWRNSWERQHYVEGEWKPLKGLRLWGNLRYGLNQQQGGVLIEGRDLGRDSISLWTSVLKAEYVWQPTRNWLVFGQFKSLFLQRERDSQAIALSDERTFVPIVKGRYAITPRTELWLGMQGLPGVPMRVEDRADGFNSREEKVWVAQVTNRSPYLGYDIAMNLGFMLTNRDYDLASREIDDVNVASVYMRVVLGYSL